MALIKIYSESNDVEQLSDTARTIKLVAAAALNCPEIPTKPSQVETVIGKSIDLIGIDYILEVVACERPNLQKIGNAVISGLNAVYPDKLFSVYFNIINEDGMATTPRQHIDDEPISMDEAIEQSKMKP